MQIIVDILQVILFLAKVALGAGLIVVGAWIGTMIHDEVSDWVKIRRAENKKRQADDDKFFTKMVKAKRRTPPAKHRLGVPREDDTPLFPPPKKPLINDNTFFEQLLEDREQFAPLF